MDEEENFKRLLSQSTSAPPPSWGSTPQTDDPWANPFSDAPASSGNPFASTSSTFDSASIPSNPYATSGPASPLSPKFETSPYVQKLNEESDALGNTVDPPSVIAAREQEASSGFGGFGEDGAGPSSPTYGAGFGLGDGDENERRDSQATPPVSTRKLPSALVDEEFLAASDPSSSLKKAFVKSSPAPRQSLKAGAEDTKRDAQPYVFTPTKKKASASIPPKEAIAVVSKSPQQQNGQDKEETKQVDRASPSSKATEPVPSPAKKNADTAPSAIPLPESTDITPTGSRQPTPLPKVPQSATDSDAPPSSTLPTPQSDRVAVSPLDPPSAAADYGFKGLSIGAATSSTPPLSSKSDLWGSKNDSASSSARFGGRGWGAMDDDGDATGAGAGVSQDGLFGAGGPSIRAADPWSNGDEQEQGWGGENTADTTASSSTSHSRTSSSASSSTNNGTPRKNGTPSSASRPMFTISVGDPTRVGDPVRGYTVYTVRTHTRSPHYRKSDFSVLRRFSDFLWLYEALTSNNPGVVVPPVPDKHPFGRFQDTFIETRRLALEKCLIKMTSHPVLQLDPDLRLFLESDSFAIESKNRKLESAAQEKTATGLLSTWTGPKFTEQDDWFDSRRSFLDGLESQLKGLSKSIETASKNRLELAMAIGDFSTTITALSDSDLGVSMCNALARLADLAAREKDANEKLATAEVMNLLNLSDEYLRFIASVRLAFASRIKCYERWQNSEKELVRVRQAREKARQQGRLGDRVNQSLQEIGEAERRTRDASTEFENVTRLVKAEFARFERERVEEFKKVLEKHLDVQISKQKELIGAWEEYHALVLKMVQRSQGVET